MATGYTLYVRHEVYALLGRLPRKQRIRILEFLGRLPADPFQHGDYEARSPQGRPIQVKIIGPFAVLFWADHAVSEVKVPDIVPADK
jgi:hypothetical protein